MIGFKNRMKYNSIIGLTIEKARELSPDMKIRAVITDGVPARIKMDAVKNRINVEVKDGKIVRVINIG